jgi:hypothetical protein
MQMGVNIHCPGIKNIGLPRTMELSPVIQCLRFLAGFSSNESVPGV